MLFFSSRKIFFSLIQISKKKELIAEKKNFLSEKKLRMRALPFQCDAFPATKKIYYKSAIFAHHKTYLDVI